jgi:predicted translin family RNA/ssDNA-binding protein
MESFNQRPLDLQPVFSIEELTMNHDPSDLLDDARRALDRANNALSTLEDWFQSLETSLARRMIAVALQDIAEAQSLIRPPAGL